MLKLIPKNWLSWDFRVLEDGREVALIDRQWFRERATFAIGSDRYEVRRTSVVRGTFVLERGGEVVAEARKPSPFHRRFEISLGHDRLILEAASALRREFRLRRGSQRVGAIRPMAPIRRTATAEFAHGIPTEVQLFVAFLVLVLWKRAADAAAGGG